MEVIPTMLDQEDPINGFQGDLNMHSFEEGLNPLHYAATNGQTEVVEALLEARVDPHVRTRTPYGVDPDEGKTALQIAEEWGWDDMIPLLQVAEAREPKGSYVLYGIFNNMKVHPPDRPDGRDPEQLKRVRKKLRDLRRPGYFVPEGQRPTTVGLLFPGLGSEHATMLDNCPEDLLALAQRICGLDLREACQKPEMLVKPSVALPSLFLASIAALTPLRAKLTGVPLAAAGLGVGELAALAAAGVLTCEDGLRLASAYGSWRPEENECEAGAILSIAGIRMEKVQGLCERVNEELDCGGCCEVAMDLFPKGVTCAGSVAAMTRLRVLALEGGAVQAKMGSDHGALHTKAMSPVSARLAEVFREIGTRLRPPKCAVFLNNHGKAVQPGLDPELIWRHVVAQLTSLVHWQACVKGMLKAGATEIYEVGPGKQLKMMLKRIDPEIFAHAHNIEV